MIEALHDQPSFSKVFMDDLFSKNREIEEDVIDQLSNSSGRAADRARAHGAGSNRARSLQ